MGYASVSISVVLPVMRLNIQGRQTVKGIKGS